MHSGRRGSGARWSVRPRCSQGEGAEGERKVDGWDEGVIATCMLVKPERPCGHPPLPPATSAATHRHQVFNGFLQCGGFL